MASIGTPLDFITFHLKGTDFAINKIGNFTSEKQSADIPAFSPSLDFIKECARNNLSEDCCNSREPQAFRFMLLNVT